MISRFLRPYFPANDIAAEYIKDQVEIIKHSLNWSVQICYIPGPNLIWSSCTVRSWLAMLSGFLATASMVLHLLFPENAIKSWFGCYILTFISKGRYYLARRKALKTFAVYGIEYLLPFFRCKFIGRIWMIRVCTAVFNRTMFLIKADPTIVSSFGYAETFTCYR